MAHDIPIALKQNTNVYLYPIQDTGIDPDAISNDYQSNGAFGSKKLLSVTG
ncbi:hypothetical protein SynRS9907_00538 [Synechococcus sp. RS9907]|nr:hypothetical protein SynRS9907_00538 [Synechococcus sp. RS9907]